MKKILLFIFLINVAASVYAVDYLDVLDRYAKYDKTRITGRIVNSSKQQFSNGQVVYSYFYENGWEKRLSIASCGYCQGTGACRGLHMGFGVCFQCQNTGRCIYCGGTGKSITVLGMNNKEGATIDASGVLRYTGGGSSSGGSYGSSGSHSSGSSSSGSTYTKCKECGGGGGCRKCNGTGQVYYPSGNYNVSSYQKCPSCNGSGRCYMCHGTGRY